MVNSLLKQYMVKTYLTRFQINEGDIYMVYKMKLNESPFEKIKNGIKTVEFRLYDKKRQQIKIGDQIEFFKLPDLQ